MTGHIQHICRDSLRCELFNTTSGVSLLQMSLYTKSSYNIWFLSRVHRHMLFKVADICKWLVTFWTRVQFFSCMKSHMRRQVTWKAKGLGTQGTFIRFLTSVNSCVPFQHARFCKGLVAFRADMEFVSSMSSKMLLKAARISKMFGYNVNNWRVFLLCEFSCASWEEFVSKKCWHILNNWRVSHGYGLDYVALNQFISRTICHTVDKSILCVEVQLYSWNYLTNNCFILQPQKISHCISNSVLVMNIVGHHYF